MQADLFAEARRGRADAPEVLEALEVDYTPVAVAVQLLVALIAEANLPTPSRILDPSAGSGCWPRAARAVFGEQPFIVGVEPRASESQNIRDACNEAHTLDCATYLATLPGAPVVGPPPRPRMSPFDLICTNPPFSAFESSCFWPLEFLRAGLLHADSFVVFYGLTQWGQSDDAVTAMRAWPPSLCLRLGGRPQHRGKGTKRLAKIPKSRQVPGGPTHELRDNGGDSREYCAWVWSARDGRERRGGLPSWRTVQLPVLDAPLRQWLPDDVPGLRPIDQALVERLRGELQ